MQEPLTVGAAAAETGWSARMLRYLEEHGLVVPHAHRRRLPALRPGRAEPPAVAARAAAAVRARARRARVRPPAAPRARAPRGPSTTGSRPATTPAPGSNGSSASTSGCSQPDRSRRLTRDEKREGFMATTKTHDVKDLSLAPEGVRRIMWADRQMPVLHRDPRALRARAAARRLPHLGLPPRDHRDREPDAHAEGGRRRRRAVRVEPALHAGRRRRGARRRVRHPGLRDQGRGQRHLLLAHRGRGRSQAAADDGRRRRRDQRPPQRRGASSSATSSPAWRRRPPASSA